MNRKNIVCVMIICIVILCFAFAAGADASSCQSTYNPYTGATNGNSSYYSYGNSNSSNNYSHYGYDYGNNNANSYTGYSTNSCSSASKSSGASSCSGTGSCGSSNSYVGNGVCNTNSANSCGSYSNCNGTNNCNTSYYAPGYRCATGNMACKQKSPCGYIGGPGNSSCSAGQNSYCPPQSSPSNPNQKPKQDDGYYTPSMLTSQERILADMVNYDRTNRGLKALNVDLQLVSLARQKSLDMIQNGYFAHESPTYGNAAKMLKDAGYQYNGVAENIARNWSTEKAHAALMSSDGHRRNILGPQWTKMGIGIVNDFNGYPYITELFVR